MKRFLIALSLLALMGADDDGCVTEPEHMQTTRDGRCKDSSFIPQKGMAYSCPDGMKLEPPVQNSDVVVCRCPTGGGR